MIPLALCMLCKGGYRIPIVFTVKNDQIRCVRTRSLLKTERILSADSKGRITLQTMPRVRGRESGEEGARCPSPYPYFRDTHPLTFRNSTLQLKSLGQQPR